MPPPDKRGVVLTFGDDPEPGEKFPKVIHVGPTKPDWAHAWITSTEIATREDVVKHGSVCVLFPRDGEQDEDFRVRVIAWLDDDAACVARLMTNSFLKMLKEDHLHIAPSFEMAAVCSALWSNTNELVRVSSSFKPANGSEEKLTELLTHRGHIAAYKV